MNFFKTVFSDEHLPNPKGKEEENDEDDAEERPILNANPKEGAEGEGKSQSTSDPDATSAARSTSWGFGSLLKTITTRSEQVMESYRRDLEEFRAGLTQETAAAARAVVANLPRSLDDGASVAQESLESVGQAIDVVFKGTADLISHGKEALLSLDNPASAATTASSSSTKKISRFEMELHAIQCDQTTYCEDPDDVDEFNKWKSEFCLLEKGEEIEELLQENVIVSGFFAKLVPKNVDSNAFWSRYFFRVHKLKQVEEARAHLVKRVISADEDEDLSWEVDDDDYEEESHKNDVKDKKEAKDDDVGSENRDATIVKTTKIGSDLEEKKLGTESILESKVLQTPSNPRHGEDPESCGKDTEIKDDQLAEESRASGGKASGGAKLGAGESGKVDESSVMDSQVSVQEEDEIGWDEIEDIGSGDEKKMATSGASPNKIDIRKRLTIADDDEELSWDIEDDEDAVATKP
ncbi:uncharacterized protein LOC116265041 [Nymphaea colorata]|uniref:BSD domain-containing protein n=1 Tax=Nymphaea colorata TaxID=210225 RepID=A0A5K0XTA7_9MAGN|nr:uncharacterized protein LOC116265041 [Nymphaea colorata]